MESITILVQEHDNILRMLDVIHRASLGILAGAPIKVEDFKQIVVFIRRYADKTHHGKEEAFLFQAMLDELGDVGENLIRYGMLVEHDLGRLYVSDLDDAINSYEAQATEEAKLSILVAAGSYEQLLRRHIQKENDVVFSFGEKKLSEKAVGQVEAHVQDFETDEANVAERHRLLEILSAMERKYL